MAIKDKQQLRERTEKRAHMPCRKREYISSDGGD